MVWSACWSPHFTWYDMGVVAWFGVGSLGRWNDGTPTLTLDRASTGHCTAPTPPPPPPHSSRIGIFHQSGWNIMGSIANECHTKKYLWILQTLQTSSVLGREWSLFNGNNQMVWTDPERIAHTAITCLGSPPLFGLVPHWGLVMLERAGRVGKKHVCNKY